MSDVREDILARLAVVVGTVPDIVSVQRNNVDWPEFLMPCAIVLDGDEEVVSGNDTTRPSNRPLVVDMTPEIQIVKEADSVGTDLTNFRTELMKLVLTDATLNTLTGSNGKISYLGCETAFGWMEKQYGVLQMRFAFKYYLETKTL